MQNARKNAPENNFITQGNHSEPCVGSQGHNHDPNSFQTGKILGIFAGLGQYIPERMQKAG
jgi:hypothetical protein